jgi:hypothetical protein
VELLDVGIELSRGHAATAGQSLHEAKLLLGDRVSLGLLLRGLRWLRGRKELGMWLGGLVILEFGFNAVTDERKGLLNALLEIAGIKSCGEFDLDGGLVAAGTKLLILDGNFLGVGGAELQH